MPSKVILIVIEFMFLGINIFWALFRAHLKPRLLARAKMSLSRAQKYTFCTSFKGHTTCNVYFATRCVVLNDVIDCHQCCQVFIRVYLFNVKIKVGDNWIGDLCSFVDVNLIFICEFVCFYGIIGQLDGWWMTRIRISWFSSFQVKSLSLLKRFEKFMSSRRRQSKLNIGIASRLTCPAVRRLQEGWISIIVS